MQKLVNTLSLQKRIEVLYCILNSPCSSTHPHYPSIVPLHFLPPTQTQTPLRNHPPSQGRLLRRNRAQQGEKAKAKAEARVESFVVGGDIEKGERLQWIVKGGKFKASFL